MSLLRGLAAAGSRRGGDARARSARREFCGDLLPDVKQKTNALKKKKDADWVNNRDVGQNGRWQRKSRQGFVALVGHNEFFI